MTAVGAPCPIRVEGNQVHIGNRALPIGRVTDLEIRRIDPRTKENSPQLRLCMDGGMGLKSGRVVFDFQLETAEETDEFARQILGRKDSTFDLHAQRISSKLVPDNAGKLQGEISMQFSPEGDPRECQANKFASVVAPVFFPGYQAVAHAQDELVTLTSPEGTQEEVVRRMNQAFNALNKQTSGQVGRLVKDPLFSIEECPPVERPLHKNWVQTPQYLSTREGISKRVPEDGPDHSRYVQKSLDPLSAPKAAVSRAALSRMAEEISGISEEIRAKLAPFLQRCREEEIVDGLDFEVFTNSSPFLPENSPFSREEEEKIAAVRSWLFQRPGGET